ncbi:MbnP family protein [uncultured Chitinophaga sp.]|uniref:MbnP family protein n=1 Tax=uncultured Chitinophaga sp. TaxID=339340 RepID=UPI0025D1E407|nr:MbnP family protein [uncultured Chitinophaga sp.]
MKRILTLIGIATFIMACSKESNPAPAPTGEKATLSIQFDNIIGSKNLQLNTGNYTNAAGEQFSISKLQYYISNIRVKTTAGVEFVVPQDSSYFLVNEAEPASQFLKVRVPEGDYATLTFVLGVDSLRSTMDISKRTGALDPSSGMDAGMYWGWNSGYIFFKMEGLSAAAPVDPSGQNKFRYHIGGFGGYSAPTLNNIKTIVIDLTAGGIARVRKGREANIHIMTDVMKLFNGGTMVSIAAHPTVMFSDYSVLIANNYTSMFTHDHTEN